MPSSSFAFAATADTQTASATPQETPVRRKVVIVHSGARDRYQLAVALSRAGLLECLVTDFFWSEETPLRAWIASCLPTRVLSILRQRSAPGLPASQVKTCVTAGVASLLLDKARGVPFTFRRWCTRVSDARLGAVAGRIARRRNSEMFSYSYYAYDAFRAAGRPGILFQMHPHPATMRAILLDELQAQPDCRESLLQEWELNLPEDDFCRLANEPGMARHVLAASSFTRKSLVENDVPADRVEVVPYGIDLTKYCVNANSTQDTGGPLKLLFVGRINQRKGIKYLLEALALLPDADLELTVCGRIIDGLKLFEQAGTRVQVKASVSSEKLVELYQTSDLLVLPSIAEGFGQVLLEALACGLPLLATTHTAAPDLIEDGCQGFIVEPRSPEQIATKIQWALTHRQELLHMRAQARACAERFPWSRFQDGVVHCVTEYLADTRQSCREVA